MSPDEDHTMNSDYTNTIEQPAFDVVIMGGGLAGLTLARQLKMRREATTILVVEKNSHPVPEAAHKIGESTVELGANYLREVLDLKEMLEQSHLFKAGLRFFLKYADNSQIERRFELGSPLIPPVPSMQIDRGRFENQLGCLIQEMGVCFWDNASIANIELDEAVHTLTVKRDGAEHAVTARWVIDASGRTALLKRQLNLEKSSEHAGNAVWFRMDAVITPHRWSDAGGFQMYFPEETRRLSTTHLMGTGYWVWLIPLPSGGTSVGIVADAEMHPMSEMNRFEKALAWLHAHEPQCAGVIEQHRDTLQDFKALRNYSHSCERVFSADRWALTGISGAFLDPLYSMGTDMIGMSNTFVTDLIERDLAGESITQLANQYNKLYLDIFEYYIIWFRGHGEVMGSGAPLFAKLIWDTAFYWAFVTPIFMQGKLTDMNFVEVVNTEMLDHHGRLNAHMQEFFKAWAKVDTLQLCDQFRYLGKFDFLLHLHFQLAEMLPEDALKRQLHANADFLEGFAQQLVGKVGERFPQLTEQFGKPDEIYRYGAPTLTQKNLKIDLTWLPTVEALPV